MRSIEAPESFPGKLGILARSSIAATFGRNPDQAFNEVFRESYRAADNPYRSPRAYSNPPLEALENQICGFALSSGRGEIDSLPWTERRFSQGLHLTAFVAFSDQGVPIPREYFVPDLSREFVDGVQNEADTKQRQITLPEQFATALDIANGSVLGASLIAHAGARSIARRSDTRIDPKFNYTIEEVRRWRDCVSNFEAISGVYDDPPAETYHFWGTFIAGLLSETGDRKRDRVFNPIYRKLYTNAAEIQEFLRYRIGRKGGVSHKQADVLGYHLGSMVGSALKAR